MQESTVVAGKICLQYGSGWCAPTGWLNFDASPTLRLERIPVVGRFIRKNARPFPLNVQSGDIVRGLPVDNGSVDLVFCSHVLEHLSLADCHKALRNTLILLRPGGIFRLVLPDARRLAGTYLADSASGDPEAVHRFMRELGMGVEVRPRGMPEFVKSWLGNAQHLWMWDTPAMQAALHEAGFVDIRRCSFGDSLDPDFAAVEERSRFFGEDGKPELAMEARRPSGPVPR